MSLPKFVLLCQIFLELILSLAAVKIGISKPLPLTTTIAPNTSTIDSTTEETAVETTETYVSTTISTLKATTTPGNSPEAEWPEFPPSKTSKISTTKKPTTTTIKPSTSTTISTPSELDNEQNSTTTRDTPETFLPKYSTKHIYCFCDISRDMCDINCCCDTDCSPEALKVFRCLIEKPIDLEIHEGRFEDFKFQHGLPSCEKNDGWLCVFRTNKPIVKEEFTVSYGDTSRYYKWPNLLLETEDIKNSEFYKYGDILRIINMETKEILNFDLPSSFNSHSCQIREPVYHLKSNQRTCLISSYKTLKDTINELINLQENYKIFIKPTIPEDLFNNKDLQNYIGNITINQCIDNAENCSKYPFNKTENDYDELFKVKVNILHNFTHIHEMVLNLWLRSMTEFNFEDTNTEEYWLEYVIEFLNNTSKEFYSLKLNNNNENKPKIVSGALGYMAGKPLIIGRYEPFNKTLPLSNKNQVINYFLENNTDSHTLSLFGKESGECTRHSKQEYIAFGINTAKYCKIKVYNDSLLWEEPLKTNFTKICLNLQEKIHEQLFGEDLLSSDLTSYMISKLGRPENNSRKWLPLEVYNTNFNTVFGQYIQETNTFICRNILLSLTYEFHMATVTVDSISWQNVIEHAALYLAERHDLEFALDENLEVPITITARFFDANEKAISAADIFMKFHLIYYFIIVELVLVLIL